MEQHVLQNDTRDQGAELAKVIEDYLNDVTQSAGRLARSKRLLGDDYSVNEYNNINDYHEVNSQVGQKDPNIYSHGVALSDATITIISALSDPSQHDALVDLHNMLTAWRIGSGHITQQTKISLRDHKDLPKVAHELVALAELGEVSPELKAARKKARDMLRKRRARAGDEADGRSDDSATGKRGVGRPRSQADEELAALATLGELSPDMKEARDRARAILRSRAWWAAQTNGRQ